MNLDYTTPPAPPSTADPELNVHVWANRAHTHTLVDDCTQPNKATHDTGRNSILELITTNRLKTDAVFNWTSERAPARCLLGLGLDTWLEEICSFGTTNQATAPTSNQDRYSALSN